MRKKQKDRLEDLILKALNKGYTIILDPDFLNSPGSHGMVTVSFEKKDHRHIFFKSNEELFQKLNESLKEMLET